MKKKQNKFTIKKINKNYKAIIQNIKKIMILNKSIFVY